MQEQKQQERSAHKTRRYLPAEALQEAEQGKALILLEEKVGDTEVPEGYTQIALTSPTDQFHALIPDQCAYYLDDNVDPDNLEAALDALADLNAAIEEADDVFDTGSPINVGGTEFAVMVREHYRDVVATGVLDRTKTKDDEQEFDQAELERLSLEDPYVDERMMAIAAITRGMTAEKIKASNLKDVLGYRDQVIEQKLGEKEIDELVDREHTATYPTDKKHILCGGRSHAYLKEEFREGKDGWDINLRDKKKTRMDITPAKLETINGLESEIHEYQQKKAAEPLSPHDAERTRMFMDMKYRAGMPVDPPSKNEQS